MRLHIRLLAAIAVALAGCSSTTSLGSTSPSSPATAEPTATAIPAPTRTLVATQVPESPIQVTGYSAIGASDPFTLAGGSYTVDWSTEANTAGCFFSLFLATKLDGPKVKDAGNAIVPGADFYSGTDEWSGVPAGSYVLQEDRSGLANCAGPWSATITPK